MTLLTKLPSRQHIVPERRTPLSEHQWDIQKRKGIFTTQRGEPFAIPMDRLGQPTRFLERKLWRQDPEHGVYRPGVRFAAREFQLQKNVLHWLRDRVDQRIPYWYYMLTLGHDLHVSTYGNLYGKHWHIGWTNPFNPELQDEPLDSEFTSRDDALLLKHWGLRGFVENLGWLSGGLVTTAFVSEEIDELVSTTGTEYADFDQHEVGTGSTTELNSQTALVATSGIDRVVGTPTDVDPIYRNVGTITADATESWEEHGLFNNTAGAAMMDRSLTGGQSVVLSDQVQYTYELTKNAE